MVARLRHQRNLSQTPISSKSRIEIEDKNVLTKATFIGIIIVKEKRKGGQARVTLPLKAAIHKVP